MVQIFGLLFFLTLMREENSEKMNIIIWRSKQLERKAWSTLSGEVKVMQHAIDEGNQLKTLSEGMGLCTTT